MTDKKSDRLGTMVFTIANELVNHFGKKLDRAVIDDITRNLTLEMCSGPTSWAFSVLDQASQPTSATLNFVCTALPGPGNECAFVELENEAGESLGHGEWRNREDGLVELHIAAPKVIFDETKERQLFEAQFVREQQRLGKYYTDLTVEHKWRGWLACAQSRAKAGEVGHE